MLLLHFLSPLIRLPDGRVPPDAFPFSTPFRHMLLKGQLRRGRRGQVGEFLRLRYVI